MRIIALSTLKSYWITNPSSEQSLKSWVQENKNERWKNSSQLKSKYRNASIISSKRVVFNIKGNEFRLIVDIEYRLGILFIVWIGNHNEYDLINVNAVKHVKTNKK